jgi:hypothetical protein
MLWPISTVSSGTIQVRLLPLAMGLTLLVDSLPALLGVRKET